MGHHLKLTQNRRRKPRLACTQFYNIQNNMAILVQKLYGNLCSYFWDLFTVWKLCRTGCPSNEHLKNWFTNGPRDLRGYYAISDCPYMNGLKIC